MYYLLKTRIIYTRHCLRRIKERRVSISDIQEAIEHPVQLVYDTWNEVYIAVSIKGIATVYAFHGNYIEVLTVLGKREYEALASKYGRSRYKVIY